MLLASFAEILSIGAVLPFLAVLTAPERVFEHVGMQSIIQAFGIMTPEQLLLPLTVIFGAAAFIASGMRLLLLRIGTRLSFSTGADLSINIYRRTLYQPYEVHCARNSSEVYNAWNKGLAQAKGDWICFLGADDYFWDAQVLERIVNSLERLPPEIRVAYGQIMLVDSSRHSLHAIGESWDKIKTRFQQIMSIPHPGVMHRSSVFQQHGRFNESFRIAGDYELLLREFKTRDAFYIPDIITVAMMQGGISSNPTNSLLAMREIRHAQKMHGQRLPGWIWLAATARVYLRFLLFRLFGAALASKALDLYKHVKQGAEGK